MIVLAKSFLQISSTLILAASIFFSSISISKPLIVGIVNSPEIVLGSSTGAGKPA